MTRDGIGQISLFELELLGELGSHASLRSLGRAKHLEPPHLSKILAKLEIKLKATVIKRSPKGYLLTPQGLRLVKIAREMLPYRDALTDGNLPETDDVPQMLTVAAARFVASHLLAPAVEKLRAKDPKLRFRLIDMAPDEIEQAALKSACELLVSIGEPTLTRAWETSRVGYLSWGLYAARRHPIGTAVKESVVAGYPFLVPTYWKGNGFEKGEDGCPLSWRKRKHGDESSSVITAVEILRHSPDQLLFAPRVVMKQPVATGDLKEIRVAEWEKIERPIYLSLRGDAVNKPLEKRLLVALGDQLT